MTEVRVGYILRISVLCAALLSALGFVGLQIALLDNSTARSVMHIGLLSLIYLQVVRVLFTIWIFAERKEWIFVGCAIWIFFGLLFCLW